jgi:transcriptional regulator with XRE-family HTH domain
VPIERETVGLRIRWARKELRKMTQPQLAAAAKIKQPSLSELETGETKEISGPVLISLSKALRVRPEWVMTGDEPIEPVTEVLSADERELLANYRGASSRWKISVRYMAGLRQDNDQEQVAEGVNMLLARILGSKPYPVEKMGPGWRRPDVVHEPEPVKGAHRFSTRDGEHAHTSKSAGSKKRITR